jgi:biopolymer transport protein ExbD
MRLLTPRPARDFDDALIPLINIVFLLMIFFMLAGQIRAPDALSITPPASSQAQPGRARSIVILLDAEGRIALDGALIDLDQLGAQLAAKVARDKAQPPAQTPPEQPPAAETPAAQAASAQAPTTEAPAIMLKADAGLRHARLREVLAQLRALGIERIELLSQPASD